MINDEKCENAETIAEINAADLDDVLAGRNAYFLSVFTAWKWAKTLLLEEAHFCASSLFDNQMTTFWYFNFKKM